MKLYRYRNMSSRGLSRIFTHCELYFASPTQFNDPFDCNPPFSNGNSVDDLRSHFQKAFPATLKSLGVKLDNQQMQAKIEEKIVAIIHTDSFQSVIAQPFINTCFEENSELGVLCLSESPDDIIMWSHYADGHRGIVLQFDKEELESVPDFSYFKEVEYKNNILTLRDLNNYTGAPNELARLILLMKTERWSYENEWRIIVDPSGRKDVPNCRILTYPKKALTGVIFGCNMTPQDRYTVQMWLKDGNQKAHVHQAIKETGAYSLRIDPPL